MENGTNSFRVLSFNLNILPSFSLVWTGDHGFAKERADEFLLQIQQKDYQILILQELFSSPHLTMFCMQAKIIEEAKKLGFKVLNKVVSYLAIGFFPHFII
jgi:hypothetical protein